MTVKHLTRANTTPISFSSSFSSNSFTTQPIITPPIVGGGGSGGQARRRNKFRAWVAGWAKDLRLFFRIKQRPPPPPDVPIPTPQSPAGQKVTILAEPPTKEKPISVVASIPSDSPRGLPVEEELLVVAPPLPVYPLILNPLTAPLFKRKWTLPRASRSLQFPTVTRADGSHIESQFLEMKKPKNRSKAAATLNTLMLLLEIERQV